MGTLMIFVLLMVVPAGVTYALGRQRGCRHAWLYALAAYVIGPLALMLFLWRESFKHCPVCHAECAWDALVCRTCLFPFPMTRVEETPGDDEPGGGQKEDRMSQRVVGSDPKVTAVVLTPQQGQERPPTLPLAPDEVADPVRVRAGGEPLQVTINVTRVASASGPTTQVWRACQRVARSPWMPWHPFAVIYRSYKDGYVEAARYPGLLRTTVWIAVATGVAAILWRQWTTPISVLGGLLAFLVIIARTGQLREVLDALQAAGGIPPILSVLQYTWITVVRKAGRR